MFIDLSYNIDEFTPSYPGDDKIELIKLKSLEKDYFNSYLLKSNMHIGTHIDGISHLTSKADFISEHDINDFICMGQYFEIDNIKKEEIVENLILVINTFTKYGDFSGYKELSMEIAEEIVRKKIKIIVLDSPSPDKEPYAIHKYLLENDVMIVENASHLELLKGLKKFKIYCIPLKIRAEASLIRLFAEDLSNRE